MSNELPVIYLARRGETAWSLTGQHTGLTDLPLTQCGEQNARALGERLIGLAVPSGSARADCVLSRVQAVRADVLLFSSGHSPPVGWGSGDEGRVQRVSVIEEGPAKHVRMANLAIVGSHSTNGVAAIHSELLRRAYQLAKLIIKFIENLAGTIDGDPAM